MVKTKTTFAALLLVVFTAGVVSAGVGDKSPDFPRWSVAGPLSRGGDEHHESAGKHGSGHHDGDKNNGDDHKSGGHGNGGSAGGHGSGHGGNNHGGGDGSNDHENEPPKETHGPGSGHHGVMHYDAEYSFYGTVRWSGGAVVAGSRKLTGDNPWLGLLAPGMQLEVEGRVDGQAIIVKNINIRFPRCWSFYQGPAALVGLPGDWVKVWFQHSSGLSIFKQMAAEPDSRIMLAACYRAGQWRALPEALSPGISPSSWGWWLLAGQTNDGQITWKPVARLSAGCR